MNVAIGIIAVILRYAHWGLEYRSAWYGIVFFLNIIIFLNSFIMLRQSISRYNSYFRILDIFKDSRNFHLIEKFYNHEKRTLFFVFINFLLWFSISTISNIDLFLRYYKIADWQNVFLYFLGVPAFLILFCIFFKEETMKWLHKIIVKL